jgi:Ca2+-binding RTX toxin-like protein
VKQRRRVTPCRLGSFLRLSVLVFLANLILPASGVAITVVGTPRADLLRGTPAADKVLGAAGADRLFGYAGDDLLVGGPGRDRMYGGTGNDRLLARDGTRDYVDCGPGRDVAVVDLIDAVAGNCEVVQKPAS